MSHECDGIAFWESYYANCSDFHVYVDVTYSTLSSGSNDSRVRDTPLFYSVRSVLYGPSSALLDDDTVQGLDLSSLTLGEARVVTCSDGYTAAGDTEITMTCIFDLELMTGSADGALMSDPMLPHSTCKALMCSIGDLLLNSSLLGPAWTS